MAFLPALSGCVPSYTLNGSSINYDIYKTVDIGNFPIRAALVYPPLQQTFENELLNYVTRNTRLQEIDSNNADLKLEGEITGYSLSPRLSAPMPTQPRPASPSRSMSSTPTTRTRQTTSTRTSRHTVSSTRR